MKLHTKQVLTALASVTTIATTVIGGEDIETLTSSRHLGHGVKYKHTTEGFLRYANQNLEDAASRLVDTKPLNSITNDVHPFIVGGTAATPGEFPWFAGPAGSIVCGASLVAPDVLVSAAHCEYAFYRGAIIGAYTYGKTEHSAVKRNVIDKRIHPNFDAEQFINDIMVMKLESPVPMAPVPLNMDPQDPFEGESLITMGFGHTTYNGTNSFTLLKAEVFEFDNQECQKKYMFVRGAPPIDEETMICAYNDDPDRSACNGDSGGPLIDSSGSLIGVVSFGVKCGEAGIPPVYTRISGYADWLTQHICELSDTPPFDCRPTRTTTSPPTSIAVPLTNDFLAACTKKEELLYGSSNTEAVCECDVGNKTVVCRNVLPVDDNRANCLETEQHWLFKDNGGGDFEQLETCVTCTSGNCLTWVDRCYFVTYSGEDEPSACGIRRLDTNEVCTGCSICSSEDAGGDFGVKYNDCFGMTTPCTGVGFVASNPFVQSRTRRNLRGSTM